MIRHLTYQDIPQALRVQKAGEAQRRLQAVLANPSATPEQRESARQRQDILRQWSAGTLTSPTSTVEPSEPESTPET
jgi:septal ring-binding cell division protein DamX